MTLKRQFPCDQPLKEVKSLFPTTRVSLVQAIERVSSDEKGPASDAAFSRLCLLYWEPVHRYFCCLAWSGDDPEDLTQGFFLRLLKQGALRRYQSQKGHLRTFLRVAARAFLTDQRRKASAAKRSGSTAVISLESNSSSQSISPDVHFDRQWAACVLQRALERLKQHYVSQGQLTLFEALVPHLSWTPRRSGAEAASKHGLSPTAMRMRLHRMREKFGKLLREELRATLRPPAHGDIEEEIDYLFRLFQN